MAATLVEDTIHRAAPDNDSVQTARGLLKKNSFQDLGISADQTWLLGRCKGSGKEPYQVSVDLADPSSPTCRCNCPSRKFPCKHGLGLMLLYLASPDKFKPKEPPAELLAKREKKVVRDQKKAEGGETAPRKVNKAALTKKAGAQRDGLDLLEKLVVDLVSGGQWFEETRLDKLERQAKQLGDAYLPGAMYVLNRLILVGRDEELSDEERMARASDLIGHLWATVQKGRNYLDEKIAGDESQAEADAAIEDVLGKAWQLTELREKGYWKSGLSLLELAYERTDDEARQQRVEFSHLIELDDGSIYQAITYRPFKGMKQIPEQSSFAQTLTVAEAGVYPGFLNRRIRWEKGAEQAEEMKAAHWKKVYGHARPEFKAALDAFRQQLKHPLAPREAVVLLRCERIGKAGDSLVLEDTAGTRIEAADQRKDYSNVANLLRAAGMVGKDRPAVLARLFVRPVANTVVACPLAALTPKHHLRLGL
ncbi:MAG TPA: SWIM zinc finger family protein [Gemmataceae bacterium]|nr:SWIM zinc finger family protein [Gemmataceae bacterium]